MKKTYRKKKQKTKNKKQKTKKLIKFSKNSKLLLYKLYNMNLLEVNDIKEFNILFKNEPHFGNPLLPYSQVEQFKELEKFFKNKSVAIVGPSPSLEGQNKGSEIDSYDIVCKVGWMYNMVDDKNYGSKIDVLFNGCFSKELDPKEKFINKNIKKVISPIKSCFPGILDVHKRDLWGYYNYLKNELKEIDFYNIGILSCLFDLEANTRATLGSFAINFLLKQKIKKLGIYGFTWYKTDGYNKNYGQQNIGNHGYSHDIEINYLSNMIKNSKLNIYLNDEVKMF